MPHYNIMIIVPAACGVAVSLTPQKILLSHPAVYRSLLGNVHVDRPERRRRSKKDKKKVTKHIHASTLARAPCTSIPARLYKFAYESRSSVCRSCFSPLSPHALLPISTRLFYTHEHGHDARVRTGSSVDVLILAEL